MSSSEIRWIGDLTIIEPENIGNKRFLKVCLLEHYSFICSSRKQENGEVMANIPGNLQSIGLLGTIVRMGERHRSVGTWRENHL